MDDITLNLVALAFLAVLGGGIFLLVRRSQAVNEQKIRQMAAENGWKYISIREPLAWGLRLTCAQWTFEALSRSTGQETAPGSSDVVMTSCWQADVPGRALLIGPRTSNANLGSLGEVLVRQVLQQYLGAEAGGLNEVQTGSPSLREKYMVWAHDPAEMDRLLSQILEKDLLAWKGQPFLIKRLSGKLSIELRGVRLQKADEIRSLIHLGELFLEELGSKGEPHA
jgi:hypothetical protein